MAEKVEKKNDIYLWSRNTEFNKYLQKARYHNRKQERVMLLGPQIVFEILQQLHKFAYSI